MIARRVAAALLLLAGAAAAPLRAQSSEQRLALQLWRDSLAFIHDTAQLRRLERGIIDVARVRRDDPILHLRLGFLGLRLVDLVGRAPLDDAAAEFEWAAELQPEWPYPWFGIGLAEALLPDHAKGFAGGLWTMLGQDRGRLAGRAFARAVQLDPAFIEGVLAFAQTALDQRIDAPLAQALDAVRQAMVASAAWYPPLLLERGRLERLAGDPDSARAAFQRATMLSLRPGIAWAELARTIPLTRDTLAAVKGGRTPLDLAYFTAAASDDPEAVAMLRRDLEPILPDSILAVFDAQRGEARVAWLRRFWSERDDAALRGQGARLAEHFRRWAVARHDFRLPPFRRRYRWGIELFRSGDAELDDRGIVWLRHGAPSTRVVWPRSRPGARPDALTRASGNESWRYTRPDGDLVLHFVAFADEDDYRLVDDPRELDVAEDQLTLRSREIPGLARLLRAGPNSFPMILEEERLRGRRSIAIATQTDSWDRRYARPLKGWAQWLPAGRRDGKPVVHLVYAIDAAMLRALGRPDSIPVTVRAVFFDSLGRPDARLDTVQVMGGPSPKARAVAVHTELVVPPGRHRVRVAIEVPGNVGSLSAVDTLLIPDVTGRELTVSALLLGTAARSLQWIASPADTAYLDPSLAFHASDTLAVYAEAYGARPGTEMKVRLTIRRQRSALGRLFGGGRDEITIGEMLPAPNEVLRWRRGVELSRLEPGNYVLELTVEAGGKRVVRRRGLAVVAADP